MPELPLPIVITADDVDANGCYKYGPILGAPIVIITACNVKFCGQSFSAGVVILTCPNPVIHADGDFSAGVIVHQGGGVSSLGSTQAREIGIFHRLSGMALVSSGGPVIASGLPPTVFLPPGEGDE